MTIKIKLFATILLAAFSLPTTTSANGTITVKNTGKDTEILQPLPGKYNRIIITGNCPFGVILANDAAYKHVIGVGPWAFSHSDMNVLKDMKPDIGRITTAFINKDYTVNMESLISLKPDIIYYYGKSQDDHLERAGVPVINLDAGGETKYEPMVTQVYWENKFAETLGLPHTHKFKSAWEDTLKMISPYAANIRQQHVRALYLEESDGKQLKVSGPHTYGDTYLKMAGMENVADGLQVSGDAARYINVSMEQIMQWDPDVIFVVFGSANALLKDKIPGEDWKDLRAVKNGKVYSTPVGIHNWGGLSAETSLLPLFMISKYNPEYISDEKLRNITRDYYKKMFSYAIPENLLNEVLAQR
ncbi:ABC transporter substrate-binding protein [Serratia grimesii]|jgi:iron complex transport system substrate-binding protein|uniref:ABC transporter substrate-binding protein n=1 Tax=Serratia grimesii TaxID=82995 RepID=UPI00217B496D|nr:ABC transporter substrate-binding protein [Serratia grimesii]CAI0757487.1 corrinoid ABC transporter substrate-binding protein [Serratia grimesii]